MIGTQSINYALHFTEIDKQGYTLLDEVLSPEQCGSMSRRLTELYKERQKAGLDRHPTVDPAREWFVFNLHNKDDMFVPFIDHPAITPILEHYLDNTLILSYLNARSSVQACKPQHFHVDCRVPFPTTIIMMQAIWMINDFTIENGATRVIPGSHRFSEAPNRPLHHPQERSVTGKAGSVLVYNSSLWHGAGPSVVPGPRWGILAIYSRWFIKPSMDFTKNTPPDRYARLSLRQKQYLGFNSIPPYDEAVRISTLTPLEDLPSKI